MPPCPLRRHIAPEPARDTARSDRDRSSADSMRPGSRTTQAPVSSSSTCNAATDVGGRTWPRFARGASRRPSGQAALRAAGGPRIARSTCGSYIPQGYGHYTRSPKERTTCGDPRPAESAPRRVSASDISNVTTPLSRWGRDISMASPTCTGHRTSRPAGLLAASSSPPLSA